MNVSTLSPRLLAAADFVREGAFVADVGTDHAYLPIYLCTIGKVRGALASDINEGPLKKAVENIKKHKLEDKISTLLTSGLTGAEHYTPDDIIICGMGGDLICEIISAASWTKNIKHRLILQPMTHAEKLRSFLCREGYAIIGETMIKDEKLYSIICAEYSGNVSYPSDIELIFGKQNIEKRNETFLEYAEYVKSVYLTKKNGKQKAGLDISEEERIINEIEKILI